MTVGRIIGLRATTVLLAVFMTISAGAEQTKPPLLQVGRVEAISVDGRSNDAGWQHATALGPLVDSAGLPGDVPAQIQLAWDERGLCVLWQIDGEPTFRRREHDGDLWRDDAVELRLRTGEDGPIHRFAISPGGAMFDARDSDTTWDPVWRALALRSGDGWQVEMRVPLATLGAQPGDTLHANLLVNDSEADGPIAWWAAPGETGADTFGLLRLDQQRSPVTLAQLDVTGETAIIHPEFSGAATLHATLFEGETEVASAETSEARPLSVPMPHPGRFRIRIAGVRPDGELALQREIPLERIPPLAVSIRSRLLSARQIGVTIDGAGLAAAPEQYVIAATGAEAVTVTPDGDRTATATVDLSPCPPGEVQVRVTAGADGDDLASATQTVDLPAQPDWANSSRGKHARLMSPWTPVHVEGNSVRCWDREYDFGEQPLPKSITSGGESLLAAPMALRARVGTTMRDWDDARLRWIETTQTHAVALIRAESPLAEARLRAECRFDGLMTFDLKIDARTRRPLSEVRMVIPMTREFADHLRVVGNMAEEPAAMSTPAGGWTHPFAPLVELTGSGRGLQWLCPSDAGWALGEPDMALEITRGRRRTGLTVTMLDRELEPGEPFETSFALQAIPARPLPTGWREWRSVTISDPAESGQGGREALADLRDDGVRTVVLDNERFRPRPDGLGEEADETLAAFSRRCHDAGLQVMLVLEDDLSGDPVWETFGDEVMVRPRGETAEHAPPCPAGPWADYAVEAVADAMARYDLDGIHLRGGAGLWSCASGVHGCPQWGTDEPACAPLAARDLVKRLRAVIRESDPAGRLTVELSQGLSAAAGGLADGTLLRAPDSDGEADDVHAFLARGGDAALGPAVEVAIPREATAREVSEAIGLALLHDAALRPEVSDSTLPGVEKARAARERFDVATAHWRPWWADDLPVTAEANGVRTSVWWREGEALVVVANFSDSNPVVELNIDRERLDLGAWLLAVDAMSGRRVPQVGEVLRLRMEPGQTSLVHIRTRQERDVEIDE